jgi:hypothetical protein
MTAPEESLAQADLRDLTAELEDKLSRNGHQLSRMPVDSNLDVAWVVRTPQGFDYLLHLTQKPEG